MEALKPIVFVRSLKILGEAFVFVYNNRRRLLPVIVGGFLLNLALTALMVNVASPHVNLDFIRPFFELADKSTEPEKKADSPSWILINSMGEVFFVVSTIVAILLFSKASSYNLPGGQHPASFSTWREWKSLGLLLFTGAGVVIFITALLEALDLGDDLTGYFHNFFTFVYLLTSVVSSKEGLYGFSAAEKAWVLVGEKFYEITVLGAACFVLRQILDSVFMTRMFLPRKEEVKAQVIWEDTAGETFRFSVVAAFLTVILQMFECSVILTFYRRDDARHPTDQQRDRDDATAVIAATHKQPRPEAEAIRSVPPASGGSDASSSNGARALNLDTRMARPRRQIRPHPKYDPRVWQL